MLAINHEAEGMLLSEQLSRHHSDYYR